MLNWLFSVLNFLLSLLKVGFVIFYFQILWKKPQKCPDTLNYYTTFIILIHISRYQPNSLVDYLFLKKITQAFKMYLYWRMIFIIFIDSLGNYTQEHISCSLKVFRLLIILFFVPLKFSLGNTKLLWFLQCLNGGLALTLLLNLMSQRYKFLLWR